jgi:hypothetical protein
MMSLGDVAAKLGLPVFPCGENKRPITETGFKAATPDPDSIVEMFARQGAELIGVPTGAASGLVVIDIDIRDNRTGMDWLDANHDALPETRTHKTRSGGLHLLFRIPEGVEIRNSAGRIAPGVDVRGEGGYVIFPPSPGYQIADPTGPAEMPLWLIRACCKPEPEARPAQTPQLVTRFEGGTRYGLAGLEAECRAIATAPEGSKHFTLNRAAYSIGGLVSAQQIEEGVAHSALRDALGAIRDRCEDYRAAQTTLEAAFAAGMAKPRAKPEPRHAAHHDHTSDAGYWASVEADMAMTPEQWHDIEALESGQTIPASPGAGAGKNLLWKITEPWDDLAIPPRPWIARGYLMRGCVTLVSGPGSAGKSSLMVAWASALALGCAFGRFKTPCPLRVATYNVEDDANEQKRRFSAMCAQLQLKPDAFAGRLAILGPEKVGTLLHMPRDGRPMVNTPVMDRLVSFLDEFKPDVLMLDPFVEMHGAEENDNTAVRAVMAAFRAIAAERNIAIVILHHSRKGVGTPGDPDSMRGASSIVGAARVALTLNIMTEDEAKAFEIKPEDRRDHFRLDGAKSNYAPIEEAEWFKRHERRLANGDGVAVAWPWKPPNVLAATNPADLNRALDLIAAGPDPDSLYSPTKRGGNSRWAGVALQETCAMNDVQAGTVINAWLHSGLLIKDTYRDKKEGRERPGVRVDNAKRPTV